MSCHVIPIFDRCHCSLAMYEMKWSLSKPLIAKYMANIAQLIGYGYFCKISNIRRIKSQNLIDSRVILQLSLPKPLMPVIKSGMKM